MWWNQWFGWWRIWSDDDEDYGKYFPPSSIVFSSQSSIRSLEFTVRQMMMMMIIWKGGGEKLFQSSWNALHPEENSRRGRNLIIFRSHHTMIRLFSSYITLVLNAIRKWQNNMIAQERINQEPEFIILLSIIFSSATITLVISFGTICRSLANHQNDDEKENVLPVLSSSLDCNNFIFPWMNTTIILLNNLFDTIRSRRHDYTPHLFPRGPRDVCHSFPLNNHPLLVSLVT